MIMKKYCFIPALCFCLQLSFWGRAQDIYRGLKQTIDFTIDKIGNADIDVSMQLTAAQWDNFKKTIGENVSLLKRQMERELPKYYLTDFNYTEDAMNRAYNVKFKALGIGFVNRNGLWETDLDVEKPDITKLSDREFVMNEDVLANGTLIQQTVKLHLPSVAKNAKVEKDSFGKAVLTYATGQELTSQALTAFGILLVLLGAWWFYRNLQAKNKPALAQITQTGKEPNKEIAGEAIRNAAIEARESEEKRQIELKRGDVV